MTSEVRGPPPGRRTAPPGAVEPDTDREADEGRRRKRRLDPDAPRTRGGARPGAGRKPNGKRAMVSHLSRPEISYRHPALVLWRVLPEVGSLRRRVVYRVVAEALAEGKERFGARLVAQSTQRSHLHLLVEAPSHEALAPFLQGLGVRVAKRLNRVLGRNGKVFADRYEVRALATTAEVRWALGFVLSNKRHHAARAGRSLPSGWVDPCSSAREFDGWERPLEPLGVPSTAARPRTWLLREGWREHGLVPLSEVPPPRPPDRRAP